MPCEYTQRCAVYAGSPTPFWLTLFTSTFLHAGWAHILGNMLFLFVSGNPVERSMGHVRYLAFYFICGFDQRFIWRRNKPHFSAVYPRWMVPHQPLSR